MIEAPYLSPEDRAARVETLARAADAERVEYGRSVEGEPLVAVRIPGPAPDAPRILCSANIHGPEYVGGLVVLGLLEQLAQRAPVVAPLRARAEIWLVPCLNPDGYRRTWAAGGVGPLARLRTNARGVDLNRNFPLPNGARRRALPGAGSTRAGDATYCGTHPLSEPETRALHDLLAAHAFHASANLHSFMGTLIPARVTDHTSFRAYRELCRSFAAAQPKVRYRRVSSRLFDVFTGEQEDHQHHTLRTWAVCVEVFPVLASYRQHLRAPSTFWRFNPRDPTPWIENDIPGLIALFMAALDRPPP